MLKTIRTLNKLVEEGVLVKKGKRYSFPPKAGVAVEEKNDTGNDEDQLMGNSEENDDGSDNESGKSETATEFRDTHGGQQPSDERQNPERKHCDEESSDDPSSEEEESSESDSERKVSNREEAKIITEKDKKKKPRGNDHLNNDQSSPKTHSQLKRPSGHKQVAEEDSKYMRKSVAKSDGKKVKPVEQPQSKMTYDGKGKGGGKGILFGIYHYWRNKRPSKNPENESNECKALFKVGELPFRINLRLVDSQRAMT